MTRHVMAVTYKPKIKGILDSTCTQTIRRTRKKPFSVGDNLLLHGWEGRPYQSEWSWRKKVIITEVHDIVIYEDRVNKVYPDGTIFCTHWWHRLNFLASSDGIKPPTGEELKKALTDGKKIPDDGIKMHIIRWKNDTE